MKKSAGFLLGAAYLPMTIFFPLGEIIQAIGFVFAIAVLVVTFSSFIGKGEWCRTGLGTPYYKTTDIKKPPAIVICFSLGFFVGIPLLSYIYTII